MNNNQIVLGILDTAERIKTPLSEGFCRNLAEFWSVEYKMQGVNTITDTHPDELLRKAAATSAKWLIFSTLGTYFEETYPFLQELKDFIAREPDFFIMGHILDRKDYWYELHDQCFVLNLEHYRALGCPSYGTQRHGKFEMMKPERATENFHHDYTPLWVKPSREFAMYSGLENGHSLLAEGFKAELPMIAFPQRLRVSKFQFSPPVRESFARKYWWWEARIKELDRLFYAFNTESIPPLAEGYTIKPLKRLYTVSSGLLFFKVLKRFPFASGCIVHFYDTSLHGLQIMRQIVQNWDGRDYPAFLKRVSPEGALILNFQDAEQKWRKHLEDYGGEALWLEWFNRVKTHCQFRFHEANVFSEEMEWAQWLEPDPDPHADALFWLSNVFHFRYTSAMRSLEERFLMQRSMLQWLAKRNPNIFVYMCSAIGPADTVASRGIFKAADYDVQTTQVPRIWKTGTASYPLAIQHFFKTHSPRKGPVRPTPEAFRHIDVRDLSRVPLDEMARFAEWIDRECHVPSLRMDLEIPHHEMWQEAQACLPHFVKHREELNPGWESICLHGLSAQQTEDVYRYGIQDRAQAKFKWTEIADQCPVTVNWLREHWPMEIYHRVRFMLLRPGGFIQPHNDMDGKRGLSATNVALNHPKGCEMVLENYGTIPWHEGDVRRLDIGVNHSVYNGADENRYHMIIHGNVGNQFHRYNELLVRSYLKARDRGE